MLNGSVYLGMTRANYPKSTDISAVPVIPNILRNTLRGIKMKQIDVSTPKYPNTFTLVDDCDYERLNSHKWFAVVHSKFYVQRNDSSFSPPKAILMHRYITGAPRNKEIDHIDGNGLNNRRCNLRECSRSQNAMNRDKPPTNRSGYKGVHWHKIGNKWRAQITIDRKVIHLGLFTCLIKAARTYDREAKKLSGEYARFNFPEDK